MALGDNSEGSQANSLSFAEHWNGSRWSLVQLRGLTGRRNVVLNAITCPIADECIAVGQEGDNWYGPSETLAELWNGSTWRVMPTPVSGGLLGVSCLTPKDCLAVGYRGNDSYEGPSLVERWNGETWSEEAPSRMKRGSLLGITCVHPETCFVVGRRVRQPGPHSIVGYVEPVVWRLEGGKSTEIPISPPGWTANFPGNFTYGDAIASCLSATLCELAWQYHVGSGGGSIAGRLAGSDWTLQRGLKARPSFDPQVSGLACISASFCMAVGGPLVPSPRAPSVSYFWNGAAWAPSRAPEEASAQFSAVSCFDASRCVAVGWTGYGRSHVLAEDWNGTRWRIETGVAQPSG
jgi:hypothetical protein